MNRGTAAEIAQSILGPLERMPYEEAEERATNRVIDTQEVVAEGGRYQVEVEYRFDAGRSGPVRILVSVDDGGLSAIVPVTKDTIVVGSPEDRATS